MLTLISYIESLMPNKVNGVLISSLTLSRTGNIGHYQGGDACLEGKIMDFSC